VSIANRNQPRILHVPEGAFAGPDDASEATPTISQRPSPAPARTGPIHRRLQGDDAASDREDTMANFELPDLPYDYDALEPHIDARTMEIHHDRHHAGYTRKFNDALEGHPQFRGKSAEQILRDIESVPKGIRTAVRNNGGGYVNHALFWEVMSPDGGGEPGGALADAIDRAFGSFGDFQDQFTDAATGRFGSGWGWLVVDDAGGLQVYSTPNQDSPYIEGHTPILAWTSGSTPTTSTTRTSGAGTWTTFGT